jgi:hypothetical protein
MMAERHLPRCITTMGWAVETGHRVGVEVATLHEERT